MIKEKSGLDVGLYAVYDKIGELYDTPFFARDDHFAKRRFIMLCHEKGSMLGDFSADFELHNVGVFNTANGKLVAPEKAVIIIEGDQISKVEKLTDPVKGGVA